MPQRSMRQSFRISRIFAWFYQLVVKPTKLPLLFNSQHIQARLGVARILVGLIVFVRTALATFAAYYYYDPNTIFGLTANFHFISSLLMLSLSFFLMIGFFTPLSCFLLFIAYPEWDKFELTTTLGTMILIQLLLLLLLSNSGRFFSVDGILAQRGESVFAQLISKLYRIIGDPTARQLRFYQWLVFAGFGLTSFGALTFHLTDTTWLSGQTLIQSMNASFWCSQYRIVQDLSSIWPALMNCFFQCGILGQSLFQLLMLVAVYWRWGFWFVSLWSMIFFVLSWTMLQLSYLPPLELVLWFAALEPNSLRLAMEQGIYNAADAGGDKRTLRQQQSNRIMQIILPVFLVFSVLYTGQFSFATNKLPPIANDILYRFGLWCPDVFNARDLRASKSWPVIYRSYDDGRLVLAPFNAEDGARRLYYILDPIYFGNCLSWRRAAALDGVKVEEFSLPGQYGYQYVDMMICFDYKLAPEKPAAYFVRVLSATKDPANPKVVKEYYRKVSPDGTLKE